MGQVEREERNRERERDGGTDRVERQVERRSLRQDYAVRRISLPDRHLPFLSPYVRALKRGPHWPSRPFSITAIGAGLSSKTSQKLVLCTQAPGLQRSQCIYRKLSSSHRSGYGPDLGTICLVWLAGWLLPSPECWPTPESDSSSLEVKSGYLRN